MLSKLQNIKQTQRNILLLGLGVLIGLLAFGLYKFVTYSPDSTHYHANFAVYIDGELLPFEEFTYYEELTSCSTQDEPTARQRVHMHQPENSVVHVHSQGVTWGHFFENLGFAIGKNFFATDSKVYTQDKTPIYYILNGRRILGNPAQLPINNDDKLMVVIGAGSEAEAIDIYQELMPDKAHQYNESADPGACNSGEEEGLMHRMMEVF